MELQKADWCLHWVFQKQHLLCIAGLEYSNIIGFPVISHQLKWTD